MQSRRIKLRDHLPVPYHGDLVPVSRHSQKDMGARFSKNGEVGFWSKLFHVRSILFLSLCLCICLPLRLPACLSVRSSVLRPSMPPYLHPSTHPCMYGWVGIKFEVHRWVYSDHGVLVCNSIYSRTYLPNYMTSHSVTRWCEIPFIYWMKIRVWS